MHRRKLIGVALPAAIASAPIVGEAAHLVASGSSLWFWGDQALIDIEARNSILGRNLLGVYDRYGWHHPGSLWLLILGVFRWVGGGSPIAVVIGSYALQVAAVVGIVLVAERLRPGLTAWWSALLLIGYEWSFGPDRLGIIWAPYAIALPVALLVLLVAYVVTSPNPWGPFIATVVCASFLFQTDPLPAHGSNIDSGPLAYSIIRFSRVSDQITNDCLLLLIQDSHVKVDRRVKRAVPVCSLLMPATATSRR